MTSAGSSNASSASTVKVVSPTTKTLTPAEAARTIPNATRVGNAATHTDPFHRAGSWLTTEQLAQGRTSAVTWSDGINTGGTWLRVDGVVNGVHGTFEFIILPNGTVSHQLFRPH